MFRSYDPAKQGHPKIHALSNWSINVESRVNTELRWNSVVTTIYNWFGYCGYARVTFFLRMLGLFQPDLSNFQEMVDLVLDQGVPRHGNVSLLVKYSPTVKFVSRMRTYFLQEFAKHKKDFPGIDGEALFMNTVMHSLDHGLLGMINRDILWVDENGKCSCFPHGIMYVLCVSNNMSLDVLQIFLLTTYCILLWNDTTSPSKILNLAD